MAFEQVGIHLSWRGKGIAEEAVVESFRPTPLLEQVADHCRLPVPEPGTTVVKVDPEYYRPTEVETLLGDPTKARSELGWQPEVSFPELIKEMVIYDLNESTRESICRRDGFPTPSSCEAGM
jgi:GDPmannose 4,6-dehydratase